MPNPQKQEYYRKNREKRLKYQHEWYARNKDKIARKEEVLQVVDPDEWEERQRKQREYNKAYYRKNREKLLAKQRERYAAKKASAHRPCKTHFKKSSRIYIGTLESPIRPYDLQKTF